MTRPCEHRNRRPIDTDRIGKWCGAAAVPWQLHRDDRAPWDAALCDRHLAYYMRDAGWRAAPREVR